MTSIIDEKLAQAVDILAAHGVDAWMTFVRETTEAGDPVLPLILGQSLTWQSALIVTRRGDRIAIVGNYDADAVSSTGAWKEVIPYVEGIRTPLLETLDRLKPESLALNFSRDDVKADGLSHGMFQLLQEYLAGTPYADRIVSAAHIVGTLRGRKTPGEIHRLREAIATTDEIFEATAAFAQPGQTERQVADFMHDEIDRRGLDVAWDRAQCPIVNSGPNSMIGHGIPSPDIRIEPGHVLHIDFGVKQADYCSDLQRDWYVPRPGENRPPEAIQTAFDTIVKAIDAAAAALNPGIECWEVDAAARKVITDAGYPEYKHATGHQIGRAAHDGGGTLAPKWERYGQTPYRRVEESNVFTLELGIENVEGAGYIGLEEMIVVTTNGCEFISNRQEKLNLLAIGLP